MQGANMTMTAGAEGQLEKSCDLNKYWNSTSGCKHCTECGVGDSPGYTARICSAVKDALCCPNPTDMDIDGRCEDRQGGRINDNPDLSVAAADYTRLAIGLPVGILIIVLLILALCYYRRRQMREWNLNRGQGKGIYKANYNNSVKATGFSLIQPQEV